jgi:hypothetical protein
MPTTMNDLTCEVISHWASHALAQRAAHEAVAAYIR